MNMSTTTDYDYCINDDPINFPRSSTHHKLQTSHQQEDKLTKNLAELTVQKLVNPDDNEQIVEINVMKNTTDLMEETLCNVEKLLGSSVNHGHGIEEITQMLIKILQRKSMEISVMKDIVTYAEMNPDALSHLKSIFIQQLNLKFIGWPDIVERFCVVQNEHLHEANELKNILQDYIKYNLFITGSVKAGVAATSSDYDFGMHGNFNDMRNDKNYLRANFKVPGFRMLKCECIYARVKLIHLKLKHYGKIIDIDVVAKSTSKYLAEKVSRLSDEHRIWIVALKLICKRLMLIDTQTNRLSSCCLSVSILCFLKEESSPTFTSFLKWFSSFDFKRYKMTDEGIREKVVKSLDVEIIENGKNNTARCATSGVMAYCQQFFSLLSKWDDIGSYIFSLFDLRNDQFPKFLEARYEVRPEASETITDIDLYTSHMKSMLHQTAYNLTFSDTILFQDHSHGESIRRIRHKLHSLKNKITKLNSSALQEIETTFHQIKDIIQSAIIIGRMKPVEDTVYSKYLDEKLKAEISVEDFNTLRTKYKREADGLPNDNSNTRFPILVPSNYKCKICLCNDHTTENCTSKESTCLNCEKFGHMTFKCPYQQCPNCCLYGHSIKVCSTKDEPPACFNCGKRNHSARNCPNPYAIFCYLCGQGHGMLSCALYNDECYKHKGKHMFVDCPENKYVDFDKPEFE